MNPGAIAALAFLAALFALATGALAIRACVGATKRNRHGGQP